MSNHFDALQILVAEDNPVNQFLVKRMMAGLNLSPDITLNGEEALNLFLEKEYDLVLLDLDMPVLDGLQTAREIRKLNTDVPIVAITAAVLDQDKEAIAEAGMNGVIQKPFKIETLSEIIQTYTTNAG